METRNSYNCKLKLNIFTFLIGRARVHFKVYVCSVAFLRCRDFAEIGCREAFEKDRKRKIKIRNIICEK